VWNINATFVSTEYQLDSVKRASRFAGAMSDTVSWVNKMRLTMDYAHNIFISFRAGADAAGATKAERMIHHRVNRCGLDHTGLNRFFEDTLAFLCFF
jgi:hypothetical protein